MEKRGVTVFDFDGTLTKNDTFISFAIHALGIWRFLWGVLKSFPSLLLWKLGKIEGGEAKEKLYSALYKGRMRDKILRKSESFKPRYKEDILKELKKRDGAGECVLIISASLDLWMEKVSRDLDVTVLCTKTETDSEGLLTGWFSTPNCHGDEKVTRLIEEMGKLRDYILTVYGDEPQGGDAALFGVADSIIVVK
ncbi:MAG: haloacid dehalogenase-like hydrolase [Muribaculaceae bacterium]|nr:haloacid dehalogenase-like hydrolase [Muribaculaceae bacterium]